MTKYTKLKATILVLFGSQREFSRVTGIREVYISNFIHGMQVPNDKQKELIESTLGSSWNKLINKI